MGVQPNSYGTAAKVALLARVYTTGGVFDATTNPPLAAVEGWIDQVSAMLNTALAGKGFAIPITQADAVLALETVVIPAVVDLCHAANSAGRFFTDRAIQNGVSPMRAIRNEMLAWADENSAGLERLTNQRSQTLAGGIAFRETDNAGREIAPIFQRSGFGNSFTDSDPL